MDDSSPGETPGKLPIAPAYLVVLAVGALAGVWLMASAAGAWHAASAAESFPPETRRRLAFAVVFNAGLAGAIALAAAGEVVATAVRLVRRRPPVHVAGRLGFALLPMLVLAAGHHFVNPWLGDLLRAVRGVAAGG